MEELLNDYISDFDLVEYYADIIASILATLFAAMVVCWYRAIYKMRRKLIKLLAKDFISQTK